MASTFNWGFILLKPYFFVREEDTMETEIFINPDRLKMLLITKNFQDRMEKSSLYLAAKLTKYADVVTWEEDGNICDILSQLDFIPDFILLNDYKYDYSPWV